MWMFSCFNCIAFFFSPRPKDSQWLCHEICLGNERTILDPLAHEEDSTITTMKTIWVKIESLMCYYQGNLLRDKTLIITWFGQEPPQQPWPWWLFWLADILNCPPYQIGLANLDGGLLTFLWCCYVTRVCWFLPFWGSLQLVQMTNWCMGVVDRDHWKEFVGV